MPTSVRKRLSLYLGLHSKGAERGLRRLQTLTNRWGRSLVRWGKRGVMALGARSEEHTSELQSH